MGILLAGGTGSRLFPLTKATNKHLLQIYDKPMIYYSLSLLMLADIRDIVIIGRREDIPQLQSLLGDGRQWGLTLQYVEQEKPNGIAEAFLITEHLLGKANVVLALGDNIIHGSNLSAVLRNVCRNNEGASILGYPVHDPSAFGVVEVGANGKAISLEEKPKAPKSNLAVPGFYCYDNRVVDFAKSLKPSARGELEITDLNRIYLEEGTLAVNLLGRGVAWLDGGTPDGMFEASQYVQVMQARTGLVISSPEEIAWHSGWIDDDQLRALCQSGSANTYASSLLTMLAYKPE